MQTSGTVVISFLSLMSQGKEDAGACGYEV